MQRGRKSSASKAVLALLPGQRPEPPASLTPNQADIWREIAAIKPQDWFSQDTYPLLIAFCRHVDTANLLAAQINPITDMADKRFRFGHWPEVKVASVEQPKIRTFQ